MPRNLLPSFLVALSAVAILMSCGGSSSSDDGSSGGGADTALPGLDVAGDVGQSSGDAVEPKEVASDTGPATCTEGDPCDDGDPCTDNDRCENELCIGDAVTCDDENSCTDDICDPGAGGCVFKPADNACDDGDPCTDGDACVDGACAGEAVVCDDDNACTEDLCDSEAGGCVFTPTPGEPCEDGNSCTFNDACDADGACVGEVVTCDDGVDCTNDVCNADGDCLHVPEKSNCDDGDPCTADYCDPTFGCRHAGALADNPVQDGLLGDWYDPARVATNELASDISGMALRSLSVEVSPSGLHLGIEGAVADGQAWLVYLDLDYASRPEGTGLVDMLDIDGGASSLDAAARIDVDIDTFGFGAELLVGGIGPNSLSGVGDAVGCRDLRDPAAPNAVPCTVDVDSGDKSIEVTIPWSSLYGAVLVADETHAVAGFAVAVDVTHGTVSNQLLPGQVAPVHDVFFFPAAGGRCLEPYCGDGVADPGEMCDDGNDDPTDDCVSCFLPPPDGMVVVPAGTFWMGIDSEQLDDPARPRHEVRLDTYFIDTYEVTNAQFAEFLDSVGSSFNGDGELLYACADTHSAILCGGDGRFTTVEGFEEHPVGETSWRGAYEYCQWAGKRLPTEAEWEKAARDTDERLYPWGDDFESGSLNCLEWRCHDGFANSAPVGSFPDGVSPYGAYDMAGNHWEWVNDWFDATYYATSPLEDPRGPCDGAPVCALADTHVARGGSWDDDETRTMSTFRYQTSPGCRADIGLRCALSPSEQ